MALVQPYPTANNYRAMIAYCKLGVILGIAVWRLMIHVLPTSSPRRTRVKFRVGGR